MLLLLLLFFVFCRSSDICLKIWKGSENCKIPASLNFHQFIKTDVCFTFESETQKYEIVNGDVRISYYHDYDTCRKGGETSDQVVFPISNDVTSENYCRIYEPVEGYEQFSALHAELGYNEYIETIYIGNECSGEIATAFWMSVDFGTCVDNSLKECDTDTYDYQATFSTECDPQKDTVDAWEKILLIVLIVLSIIVILLILAICGVTVVVMIIGDRKKAIEDAEREGAKNVKRMDEAYQNLKDDDTEEEEEEEEYMNTTEKTDSSVDIGSSSFDPTDTSESVEY